MEAVATRGGHGKGCGPRGGPIGGVYGTAKSRIFIEPPPDTQQRRRRGERGIGVARGSYLLLTSLSPLRPPHRAPAALPGAAFSGLAERRPPPSPPLSPP
jgi:hypothetical protein